MKDFSPHQGIGTLVTHFGEGDNPHHAHITPIYQSSTFSFPDLETGLKTYRGDLAGYSYTRTSNPNPEQFANKVALLEGLDMLRENPEADPNETIFGKAFASGMAAISAAVLARVKTGDTIIAQEALYSNAFNFFHQIAPRFGIQVIWLHDVSPVSWEMAFESNPSASLVYLETPANPTMLLVDIAAVTEIAHRHGCWVMVDNTFATPYCQRPLSVGVDVVVHSTTKYLSGHGAIVGGVVVSPHRDYMRESLQLILKTLGGSPSPFDSWLANLGLKTFELRMQRHCENAMAVARYLDSHPKVSRVLYPGLESHPGHNLAIRQMQDFSGMLSFDLQGGYQAAEALLNHMRLASLAASLGNVDSLIQHPASMTHASVPLNKRRRMGISDGLVRFSVGIENVEDILSDLEGGLAVI